MIDLLAFLARQAANSEVAWSLGTFGAIAEFMREADEKVAIAAADGAVAVATARGGLRIVRHRELRLVASESPTTESWSHRVALCLPEGRCAMSGRTAFTEVGPDRAALREQDRAGVLFDLGLGALQADFCIRSADPEVVAALRQWVGKPVFDRDGGAMKVILAANPHRVFLSRLGRIEVYQPIPPADGRSPRGPHTHVLPKLLAHGRTHSANEPLPAAWVACAHFYPPHPTQDLFGQRRAFRAEHHAAFQALLARYGDPHRIALKQRIVDSVVSGAAPSALSVGSDRFDRATLRVALRQLLASEQSPAALAAWLCVHEHARPSGRGEPGEAPV